jgi:hypothetical protein
LLGHIGAIRRLKLGTIRGPAPPGASALLVAAVLAGCGDVAPSLTVTSPPSPEWAELAAYEKRCHRLDMRGANARVVYEARKEMTRGSTTTVVAAVTLNGSLPPSRVLHRPGAAAEPGIVVSCRLQAQLSASKYDFDIDDRGWVERSLLTSDTARWAWQVKPKVGGNHTVFLNVRPIVRSDKAGYLHAAEGSDVQQYETSVHVNVPWSERPQELMSRLAATFHVAEGMVKAMVGFVLAVAALLAALGIRRRRNKRLESQSA